MSQTSRILAVLADGRWHTSTELHQRCGYMRTNSRVAELRSRGHEIEGESVPGKSGTDGYRYRKIDAEPIGTPGTSSPVESAAGTLTVEAQAACPATPQVASASTPVPAVAPPKPPQPGQAQLSLEAVA